MILRYSYNKEVDGVLDTYWLIFKCKGKNYTADVCCKVREYLAGHLSSNFLYLSDVATKMYASKYSDHELTYNNTRNTWEIRTANSFDYNQKDKVTFIPI
jgi:hypothetical protein